MVDVSEHSLATNYVEFRFREPSPELRKWKFAVFVILMVPGRDLRDNVSFFLTFVISFNAKNTFLTK